MLKTAQIGRCGELLVQYRLLRLGVDSAPMTTDSGIDLVAYSPSRAKAITIQVKSNAGPKPGGGKGSLAVDWWLDLKNPADLVALVNLFSDRVWLLTQGEFHQYAQQRPEPGNRSHLYFYVDPDYRARDMCHERDFEMFRIEHRAGPLFLEA